MSSDKVEQAKNEVVSAGTEAKDQTESKVGEVQSSSDPSVMDQAKSKMEEAKAAAGEQQGKVTNTLTDTWAKTKDKFDDMNKYADKK